MSGMFDRLAEERLREAVRAGEFDDLPGKGEPLELEDLSGVPEDLRASYLLLKGANVLPEELRLRKELLRLTDLIAACTDEREASRLTDERARAGLRLRVMLEKEGRGLSADLLADYGNALEDRLERGAPGGTEARPE